MDELDIMDEVDKNQPLAISKKSRLLFGFAQGKQATGNSKLKAESFCTNPRHTQTGRGHKESRGGCDARKPLNHGLGAGMLD